MIVIIIARLYPPTRHMNGYFANIYNLPSPALIQQPSAGNAPHVVTVLLLPACAAGDKVT